MELACLVSYREERWIKHYSSSHKILLVGEGDFSFAACLARAFDSAANMVATSLDSHGSVMMKYPSVVTNLAQLQELGCTILHEVDARTMSQDSRLQWKFYDRIVFNFPHAGFDSREDSRFQIMLHQNVVKGFFRSAYEMLESNGEVHVTHKTSYPYSSWEIEKLAEKVGLRLVDKVCFSTYDYPGYENKRGAGNRSHVTFPIGECSTFKFVK